MKVFISWSGSISHEVALALRDWLPSVIQAVEPFVSSEDIERGARWFADIGSELEGVNFGILCITPQNLNAPWVLFESGALSKSMDQSRVTPLLVGIKNSDLEGPLSQFNTTSIDKPEMFKLVKTINKQLGESSLPNQTIEKAFKKWWPDLEALLFKAVKEANKSRDENFEPARTQGEILEEILELTRSISRQVTRKAEDDSLTNVQKYLLYSRYKDIPKVINDLTWHEIKDLNWNDIKLLKGKEIKFGEKVDDIITKEFLRKFVEEKNKVDKSDD